MPIFACLRPSRLSPLDHHYSKGRILRLTPEQRLLELANVSRFLGSARRRG